MFGTIAPVQEDTSADRANGYEAFFGLERPPFRLAPDTRFRFQSASHAAALAQVTYALERREPVVVITGEIGTGKTLLCRTVIERLERKTFLSVIDDPLLERDDFLKQILEDFGVVSKDRTNLRATTRHDLVQALQDFLSSLASIQAHAVVIIDEAQHVQPDVLEQIRLVSNVQDERGTMLQIVLVGQAALEQLLDRPELFQLRQRVSRLVRLDAMTPIEVAEYINHRLAVARERTTVSAIPGARDLERELAEWDRPASAPLFAPDATRAIAELSQGVPRVVNIVCDRALETAWTRQSRTIDAALVAEAAHALGFAAEPAAAPPEASPLDTAEHADDEIAPAAGRQTGRYIAIAASVALVGAAIWFGSRASSQSRNAEATRVAPVAQPRVAEQPAPSAVAPRVASEPSAAAAPPPSVPPPAAAPPARPPAAAAPSSGATMPNAFEIVVASFRTAARAGEVADSVAALGQPVRQRALGGWQQVLAGPYASSAQAQDAQQRLARAGFSGTHIVEVSK